MLEESCEVNIGHCHCTDVGKTKGCSVEVQRMKGSRGLQVCGEWYSGQREDKTLHTGGNTVAFNNEFYKLE